MVYKPFREQYEECIANGTAKKEEGDHNIYCRKYNGQCSSELCLKNMPQSKTNWEEEFDKAVDSNYRGQNPYWPNWDGVKDFIRNLLSEKNKEIQQAREETIREVLPYRRDYVSLKNERNKLEDFDDGNTNGFNQCRQIIIDNAKNKFNIII